MQCEKCGGSWIPPKGKYPPLDYCPYCGAPVLNIEKARSQKSIRDFLQYIISIYGVTIYIDESRLYNIIADLYVGDEKMKRVYRRAILEDKLPEQIYNIISYHSNKSTENIINQFAQNNFYSLDFASKIVYDFLYGFISPDKYSILIDNYKKNVVEIDGVIYNVKYKYLVKASKWVNECIIPRGITSICNDAFNDCQKLNRIFCPDSIMYIGDGAFYGCKRISNIKLPENIKDINQSVFGGCTNLETITLPNGIININDYAFELCRNLKTIIMPDSITNIGKDIFYKCDNLKCIYIPYGSKERFDMLLDYRYHFLLIESV